MIEITQDVRPSMALELEVQPAQKGQAPCTPDNLFKLTQTGAAWAVRLNGKLVALCGHVPIWPGRTMLWAMLGVDSGPAMLAVTREAKRQIAAIHVEFARVEAYVDRHHEEAKRWVALLGFRREGLMRKFANGVDYFLYSRVG